MPAALLIRALLAGPPFPVLPATPVPATVVMIPFVLTLRTALLSRPAM
jgi:hypothetical protein